jgi:hypothetical protein
MLKSFRRKIRGSQAQTEAERIATAKVLRELLSVCPLCKGSLKSHQYKMIASAPLREANLPRSQELLEAVRQQEWSRVVTFQEWEGDQPNAEVFVLRCPDDSLYVLIVLAPYALEEPYLAMHQAPVQLGSSFFLKSSQPEEWHGL